jgi:beta-glucanase (GH16 family)
LPSARAANPRTITALLVGAALACASGGPTPPAQPPPPPPPPPPANPWTQVWSDEFSGPAGSGLDTANWRYDTGDGCSQGNCGWGNNEKEYYSSDTANIQLNGEGQLAIVARTAPAGLTCYYGSCRYTSAKITTRGKVSVLPGRVEARIKLAAGQGLWPAFWMLGENIGTVGWPTCGELDIMENRGSQPTMTSSAVHGPGYSGNTPFAHPAAITANDFHVYAVEWDSQTIRYYVDGRVHFVVTRTGVQQYGNWVFSQPFYVILNQAVGGHFDGDPQSDSILPATMFVDYVRVYRRTDPG